MLTGAFAVSGFGTARKSSHKTEFPFQEGWMMFGGDGHANTSSSPPQMRAKQSLAIRKRVPMPMQNGSERPWSGAEILTFDQLADGKEHVALVFGTWEGNPLVRMHSECLTGDVFGSARCDCGPQLREAISLMRTCGGIVLYLRQEGRGIGLYNKLDAYGLQDRGLDTFAANRSLNFADDLRDYTPAAQMLSALGVSSVRLLSNNPSKADQLRQEGIGVTEMVPTGTFVNESNRNYLLSKVEKSGHLIRDMEGLL